MGLRRVTVIATGGTISGEAEDRLQTTRYQCGKLSAEDLVRGIPEARQVAKLRCLQPFDEKSLKGSAAGSPDINSHHLLVLAQLIQKELDHDECDGVVVTHGTDTIEETAFFLELTIRSDKPVVLVGAVLPATSLSSDGPRNLLCGIKVAAHPSARGRGVLVVLNDSIFPARFVDKFNVTKLNGIGAPDSGPTGHIVDEKICFLFTPCRPLGHVHFNVMGHNPAEGLPEVGILYGHQGLQPGLFKCCIERGAEGLVLAGMGAGCWTTQDGKDIISMAAEKGKGAVPIVVSRRSRSGFVEGSDNYGLEDSCIGGGFLNPQKCRILLQLALAAGIDNCGMRQIFDPSREEVLTFTVGGAVERRPEAEEAEAVLRQCFRRGARVAGVGRSRGREPRVAVRHVWHAGKYFRRHSTGASLRMQRQQASTRTSHPKRFAE